MTSNLAVQKEEQSSASKTAVCSTGSVRNWGMSLNPVMQNVIQKPRIWNGSELENTVSRGFSSTRPSYKVRNLSKPLRNKRRPRPVYAVTTSTGPFNVDAAQWKNNCIYVTHTPLLSNFHAEETSAAILWIVDNDNLQVQFKTKQMQKYIPWWCFQLWILKTYSNPLRIPSMLVLKTILSVNVFKSTYGQFFWAPRKECCAATPEISSKNIYSEVTQSIGKCTNPPCYILN